MGNCIRSLSSLLHAQPDTQPRQLNLLVLGLDGAGKTEVQHVLWDKPRTDFTPTTGCSSESFVYDDTKVQLSELGGAQGIRDIWKHYYPRAHGAIFLIDSTDHDRLIVARNLLSNIFLHSKLSGKPILVVCTKQDLPGAIDYLDFCSYLDIDHMANLTRTPCFVATMGQHDYTDLHSGMRWLLSAIVSNYRKIHNQNEYFLSFAESTDGGGAQRKDLLMARSLTGRRTRKLNESSELQRPRTAPHTTTRLKSVRKVMPVESVLHVVDLSDKNVSHQIEET